jgi:hypothetical protein
MRTTTKETQNDPRLSPSRLLLNPPLRLLTNPMRHASHHEEPQLYPHSHPRLNLSQIHPPPPNPNASLSLTPSAAPLPPHLLLRLCPPKKTPAIHDPFPYIPSVRFQALETISPSSASNRAPPAHSPLPLSRLSRLSCLYGAQAALGRDGVDGRVARAVRRRAGGEVSFAEVVSEWGWEVVALMRVREVA